MRALRYLGPGAGLVLARDVPEPVARAGEALVRPIKAAVAQLDVEVVRSKAALAPVTLGRQFVGVVERAVDSAGGKAGAAKALVGKRVVASINLVCGECELCRGGLSNHCATRGVLGLRGRDGCFAEALVLPLANLVAVPSGVDDDQALFAEPVAAAVHAARQIRLESKTYVTVLGDGPMGLLCAQLMAQMNASVRVVGRHEAKLERAGKWGIKHRLEREVGRRADQDVVIDCTGTAEGFALALQLVRPRGKIVLKGSQRAAASAEAAGAEAAGGGLSLEDLSRLTVQEVEVIGSRCGNISEGAAVLAQGGVDTVSLISRRFKLDEGLEAFAYASRSECVTAVIEIGGK